MSCIILKAETTGENEYSFKCFHCEHEETRNFEIPCSSFRVWCANCHREFVVITRENVDYEQYNLSLL